MTDLIERLRENANLKHGEAWRRSDGGQDLCIGASLAEEAADEIERLTQEINQLRSQAGDNIECQEAEQRGYERAQREIERLRAAKRRVLAIADERAKENVALRAENERLRSALKPFADYGAQIDANQATRLYGDMVGVTLDPNYHTASVKLGDLRRAASAYQQKMKTES